MMDSLKSKVADNKARIIFENERKLFDEVIKQCTDDTLIEEVQDMANYRHYKLPTGQHIYVTGQHYVITNQEISISNKSGNGIYREIFSDEFEKGHALTSPNITLFEGRGLSDVIEYRLGINERGKTASGYPLDRFSVSRGVKGIEEDKPITGYSRNWGFNDIQSHDNRSIYMDTEQDTIIGMIESISETIESNSTFDTTSREYIADVVREFDSLVEPFEIKDIEHESEESIEQRNLIIKAERLEKENSQLKQETGEKTKGEEELRQENEQLQQQNTALAKQNTQLQQENAGLKKENMSLKERFLRVRKFITERCARIPFFGKKLLREMQQELGEKELSDGEER